MAGVTDSPYRRLARRFGAGLLYSECISAEGIRRRGVKSLEYCRFHPEERPIALQLFGSRPDQIGEAAAVTAELFQPDMIDINCGCPVKKFIVKGCGGALMQDPELIGGMVEAACSSGTPVSVKLRVGYWPGDETAVRAAEAAASAGASLIALHGRFVRKAKGSAADWAPIRRVREAVPHLPVVGNGDVFSYEDAQRMIAETGCDRVMIARWALGRPWLFEALKEGEYPLFSPPEPPIGEKIAIIEDHYRMMLGTFGPKTAVFRMRKHLGWMTHGWPGGAKLRQELMTLDAAEKALELLHSYAATLDRPVDWNAIPPLVHAGEDEEGWD